MLKQGAQVSDSCYNLLVKAKLFLGQKRPIKTKTKKPKEKQEESAPEQKEIKTEEKEEKKESQG